MTEEKPDQFVGRVFQDLDPRSVGRRIRVVERTESRFGGDVYRAVRVNAHDRPISDRRLKLTRHELETEYKQEDEAPGTTPAATSAIRVKTEELRKAAEIIRKTVNELRAERPGSARVHDLIAKHRALGFSRAPLALAVADLLEEKADDAWISGDKPSEVALAVARLVVAGVS